MALICCKSMLLLLHSGVLFELCTLYPYGHVVRLANSHNKIQAFRGLYKRVKEDHSLEALKTVRHYVNTACRISRTLQHIAFSQRWHRYQVLPKSVTEKPLVQTAQGRRIAHRADSQSFSARVQQCYKELKHLETNLYFQRCQLHHVLGSEWIAAVE